MRTLPLANTRRNHQTSGGKGGDRHEEPLFERDNKIHIVKEQKVGCQDECPDDGTCEKELDLFIAKEAPAPFLDDQEIEPERECSGDHDRDQQKLECHALVIQDPSGVERETSRRYRCKGKVNRFP
jgi:hypothetical protein